MLKKRYKIENLFAKIKVFNRVHIRRDKLIASYMGFVYLAIIALQGVYVLEENYENNLKRIIFMNLS